MPPPHSSKTLTVGQLLSLTTGNQSPNSWAPEHKACLGYAELSRPNLKTLRWNPSAHVASRRLPQRLRPGLEPSTREPFATSEPAYRISPLPCENHRLLRKSKTLYRALHARRPSTT
jgi:hypothetical protein